MTKKFARTALAATAGAAGIAAGVVLGVNGLGTSAPAHAAEVVAGPHDGERLPLHRNATGQTYGSTLGRESLAEAPDLVEVVGNEGRTGYVAKEHLFAPEPSTPEEAVALTRATSGERTVPVLASDGRTQIDTFTVNKGATTDTW
ncbi:hypothetical protein [Cellulomonas sp.]|uniref:hypothetical protein n=1 Tax=Cellulomonas sp. TaxID=40001 RepID=UPI002D5022DF|nr:hypothetical protein [Cellulomonas sp.]HYQ73885.1 hypothetical protein [Cellulomonas sp.]